MKQGRRSTPGGPPPTRGSPPGGRRDRSPPGHPTPYGQLAPHPYPLPVADDGARANGRVGATFSACPPGIHGETPRVLTDAKLLPSPIRSSAPPFLRVLLLRSSVFCSSVPPCSSLRIRT